ncbi:MAG: hypothetical protein FWH37_02545 [Candidatus Bathyarchaeota archaeon]|nr:hypothetical protein [Candidatus Termiticorpusculum sp.]
MLGASGTVVRNEAELTDAVNNAIFGSGVIIFDTDIVLTTELRIPMGKDIELLSNSETEFFKLFGADGESTIFVDDGGLLRLGGVIVTHGSGGNGRGVTVNPTGMFILSGGEISGNSVSRGDGGGVYNSGTFVMEGGVISYNVAYSLGGGVFNSGVFKMSNGLITDNVASFGGGMYNQDGDFVLSGGVISYNTANWDGGGMYNQDGDFVLSGGVISYNTAFKNGGGLCVSYFETLENVFVDDGVVFENNCASKAYDRDASHDILYNSHIGSDVVWSSPFTQGYNNYDISYTWGSLYNDKKGYEFFVMVVLIVVIGVVVSVFYGRKRRSQKKVKI